MTTSNTNEQIIPSSEFYASYDHSRFSWWRYVKTESAQAAPLESFPNSPCHYYAQHIQPGVVVEVLNPDGQGNLKNDSNAYWFAEIRERYGLKIKVSYIGCRGKLELWLNATDVYPVGFCISENKKQLAKMKIEKLTAVRKSGVIPKINNSSPAPTSKPPTTASVFQKPEPPKPPKNQKPYTPRHQLVPPQEVLDNYSQETIHTDNAACKLSDTSQRFSFKNASKATDRDGRSVGNCG
jgi:hypothetical protein